MASPLAALGPCICEGFIGKSFLFLLPLPSLTTCVLVFQALRLLNDTINEGFNVEDEATVAYRGQELSYKVCELVQ
jgi:hypothetical protein